MWQQPEVHDEVLGDRSERCWILLIRRDLFAPVQGISIEDDYGESSLSVGYYGKHSGLRDRSSIFPPIITLRTNCMDSGDTLDEDGSVSVSRLITTRGVPNEHSATQTATREDL